MRNTFRYGLASIIVAGTALGATIVACGDDASSSSSSSGNIPEASTTDSPVGDTGLPDSAEAGPKVPFAKLTLINATTDLGPGARFNDRGDAAFRVCFKTGTAADKLSFAPYPPLPDRAPAPGTPPGIFYGTGGTFPSFPLDLELRVIQPIVMNARSLFDKGFVNNGDGKTTVRACDEIIGPGADAATNFAENKDYWVLPPIDAGTFKKAKAYVLALTGCVGDSALNPGTECGPGFTVNGPAGIGNLKVQVFETNTAPVSATSLGAQFLHASAQLDALYGPGGSAYPMTPGFLSDPDGGADFRAATEAPIVLGTLTAAKGVTGVKDTDLFALDKASPGSTRSLAPFPLPAIQRLSGLGATVPTVYKDGANYVFVAVGNPKAYAFQGTDGGCTLPPATLQCGDGGDGTTFNPQSFHFLAFPTDPVVAPYKP